MRRVKKQTILLVGANPHAGITASGTDPLPIDQEVRAIHRELNGSGHRDHFELKPRMAAEALDLLIALRQLRPTLVHLSCRGGRDGLVFHARGGCAHVVPVAAVAEAFGAAGTSVKVVVLSHCYSDAQAEALLTHVECVVGTGESMHRDAARIFAVGFYGALGDGASVTAAYANGAASLALEGLPDSARPGIKVRSGISANRLVPAALALADPTSCPYPGMQPYSADTAQYFHGRDAEIRELIDRLRAGEREHYVIGPSGCGKSSLVAAGVLPRLVDGRVSGLGPFVIRPMRPGDHPIARLNEALGGTAGEVIVEPVSAIAGLLAHRARSTSVLIVIDQLEEVFTASEDERAKFLGALQVLRNEARCVIISTLRADFYGELMETPLWTDRISRIEIGPLRGEALREAIEGPARTAGVSVEPVLIERLSAEAASEPGILPLLQDVLVQLWDLRTERVLARRDDRTPDTQDRVDLTLDDYSALRKGQRSGLAVALSTRADATLRALTPAQEEIARRIMLRLINFGEGRSDTRRLQPRSKLRAADEKDTDFDTVLRRLTGDRLLTMHYSEDSNDPHVDLAHEVITTAWPTLERWVKTRRPDELRRRRFEAAAAYWNERGRGAGGLLDRIELAEVEAWRRTESARELGESADLVALVAASQEAHLRSRHYAIAVIAVLAAAVALTVVQWRGEKQAIDERKRQERQSNHQLALSYQEAGRQLLLDGHPLKALPYLVEARKRGEMNETLQILYWTASRYFLVAPPLEHQADVASAAFSPDGTRVVTASMDAVARIWNASTGEPLITLVHQGEVWSATFSVDGARVVTISADKTARVWNADTGRQLAILTHPSRLHERPAHGDIQTDRLEEVRSAVFSPDGKLLLTAGDDGTARLWDAATGKPFLVPLQHHSSVRSAVFNRDGTRIVTASDDKTARIWDASTGNPLPPPLEHTGPVWAAAFSPDSSRVVTVSANDAANVWDAVTGRRLATLEHCGVVLIAAFSPDGARIVTASDDKTARIWDAATGKPLAGLLEHQGKIRSVAFSSDGLRIVTASEDKTARVWSTITGEPLAPPLEHLGSVYSAMFSVDDTRIVTASADQTARIWDAQAGKPLKHDGNVQGAAISVDGNRVVTASGDGTVRVWEVPSGRLVTTLAGNDGPVNSVIFSPDAARIVTAADGRLDAPPKPGDVRLGVTRARIWDAGTGRPLASLLGNTEVVWCAVFSPDGTQVVTASADRTARIWDAATGAQIGRALEHRGVVWSAVFSPDGSRVATASSDFTARIWNAATGEPITPPLLHHDEVRSVVFSPDGTRVATTSWDGTARIWESTTGRPLLLPLEHRGIVRSAAFSPDGTRLVTVGDDSTARVWDTITGKLLAIFLEHHGRVWSAAFSHDGKRVVTASDDGTARVWLADSGNALATLDHHGVVRNAMFSVDGKRVVTIGDNHAAHIWELRLDESLDDWAASAARDPFTLSNDGVLRKPVLTSPKNVHHPALSDPFDLLDLASPR